MSKDVVEWYDKVLRELSPGLELHYAMQQYPTYQVDKIIEIIKELEFSYEWTDGKILKVTT